MKFVPSYIEGDENAPKSSPLKEFFTLAGGLLLITVVLFVVLGWVSELIVPHISTDLEKKLGSTIASQFEDDKLLESDDDALRVKRLLDRLLKYAPRKEYEFFIWVINTEEVNAVALPGGQIIIFKGLLEKIENDNELLFVIAHELGHFYNRDHLRGLGRGLTLAVLSTIILGQDSGLSSLFTGTLTTVDRKFSQEQESNADKFALELLHKTTGSIKGAMSFFEKIDRDEQLSEILYFFTTHPSPKNRIKFIQQEIEKQNYNE